MTEAFSAARVIVFDFDGTLVDSNEIKWRGFEAVFAEHAAHVPAISAYCRDHNHTPRDEKFRYVCERILGVAYAPALAASLNARFAHATTEAIVAAPEIPGASVLVRRLARNVPLALLSSTPHAVLEQILSRRSLRAPFTWVQGAPVDKARWLTEHARAIRVPAASILFVGDAAEDRTAAAAAGCGFLGVRNAALADGDWVEDFTAIS